jgi:hypothetical protein
VLPAQACREWEFRILEFLPMRHLRNAATLGGDAADQATLGRPSSARRPSLDTR